MPRPPARLSNCYVPLTLISKTDIKDGAEGSSSTGADLVRVGRKHHELRQLCLEIGVIDTGALGSALVELGHTKVLCQVSLNFTHQDASPDVGFLDCKVQFAPHIGIDESVQRSRAVMPLDSMVSSGKLRSENMTRESSLSSQLHSALVSVLKLEEFPKCALTVVVTVLQDDGSVLSTCISAASLALADARVEMTDFVTSCTVAVREPNDQESKKEKSPIDSKVQRKRFFLADPTEAEQMEAVAVICLAMTPNLKEVTLWSQSGRLDADDASEAIDLCRNGCRTMHKFMREVWVAKQQ